MDNMNWRKSSYSSGNGGECIEVASPDDAVAVRDTKQDDAGPVLQFTPAAWRRFADHVKQSLASDPNLGSADASRGTLVSGEWPLRCVKNVRTARSPAATWYRTLTTRRPCSASMSSVRHLLAAYESPGGIWAG
jgi:hypothetical protein